jgi:ABC-2 type transport system ATP-binding protein
MSLIIDSVSKRFGEVQALDDVSLEIKPGEVFGFLGANGAGKTTAMRIVLDILRPDSGTVTWNGRSTRRCRARPGAICRKSAASTPR